MTLDIQKANFSKRISAYLFDFILMAILVVGIACGVSAILGFDGYSQRYADLTAKYETDFGVTFNIAQEEYEAMSDEEKAQYDKAFDAFAEDEEVLYVYNMIVNLSLVMITAAILLSYLILEFVVPLLLKNGQTLGKKIFGIAVMRNDCVKLTPVALFIRAFLGKFTVETMIPVILILMMFWGGIGIIGPSIVLAILIVQICMLLFSHNRAAIHDYLSLSVVVDYSSQMIFDSTEDLIAYKQRIAAEKANEQPY